MSPRLFIGLILAVVGCKSEQGVTLQDNGYVAPEDGEEDENEWTEEELEAFEGATLVILEPTSGAFVPWGEESDFEAELLDADGEPLDFDEITWTSDAQDDWLPSGLEFEDDSLEAGLHDLSVEARLPNGDRLNTTVGGIRVQHEDAGIYAGALYVDTTAEYEGTELTTTCIGSATLIVDVYGETATGESVCTIALLGYEIDAAHVFDFANQEGDLTGAAAIDLAVIQYEFEIEGEIDDGELSATWGDDVYGYADITGELDLIRITRNTELE